jgi:hypothetical protein
MIKPKKEDGLGLDLPTFYYVIIRKHKNETNKDLSLK